MVFQGNEGVAESSASKISKAKGKSSKMIDPACTSYFTPTANNFFSFPDQKMVILCIKSYESIVFHGMVYCRIYQGSIQIFGQNLTASGTYHAFYSPSTHSLLKIDSLPYNEVNDPASANCSPLIPKRNEEDPELLECLKMINFNVFDAVLILKPVKNRFFTASDSPIFKSIFQKKNLQNF